jgi:hypothetical protein
MPIKLIKDQSLPEAAAYLAELIRIEPKLDLDPFAENASKILVLRKDDSRMESDQKIMFESYTEKCVFMTLKTNRTTFEYKKSTYADLTIPLEVQIIHINLRNIEDAQLVANDLISDLVAFFSRSNPAGKTRAKKKAFPKLPQIPRCPQIVKDTSTLPKLFNSDGITDFPVKGENKTPSFRHSQFAMFPFELTLKIIETMPDVWCKGGNQFGNKAFRYWITVMECTHKNQPIPEECLRWLKKREGYIARHRKDNRLAGIIAMIKWAGFVDGPGAKANGSVDGSSLNFMLETIGYKK